MRTKHKTKKTLNGDSGIKHLKHINSNEVEIRSLKLDKIYKYFFDSSKDMLCIAGLDGYFKLINPTFEKMLGYSKEELFTKPFYEFVHPEDRDKNLAEIQSLSEGSPIEYCEHRYICKDGSYKWLAWTSYTDLDEGLIYAVGRDVTERKDLEEEISSIKEHLLTGKLDHKEIFFQIVTNSKKMISIFHYIEAIAKYQKPIFITGETGAGKELIAMAIHKASFLKGDFVVVNVAGLDSTMFSDSLFGHKKGAYTGADRDREGLIVRASGGTLFLDEIGDLNESSQVKLLRLLEDQIYYPLGADVPEKSNARIVAASNQDIQKQIQEGKFRRDLYYRLCVHHIHVPPLRERLEDIPFLIDHFLEDAARVQNKKKPSLPRELITLLMNYDYPGNIRELKGMIFDAVAQHESGILSMGSFKKFINNKRSFPRNEMFLSAQGTASMIDIFGHFPTLKESEDYLISDALSRSNGNQGIAASLLGLTRQALNNRIKRNTKRS